MRAYTAVDKAESEPELSDAINHLAVANFAQIAKEKNIKFIHISTDYVFDGTNHKPYVETDVPNPKSVYGKTKLDGELAMQKINPVNSIIIRTSWVYSKFGNNFVKTMLRLAETRDEISVVSDQIGSPTYALDLANIILNIMPKISNHKVEIFHYSNSGICSWYQFSKIIFEIKKHNIPINKVTSKQFSFKAIRPKYSLLNSSKILSKFELRSVNWKISLFKMLNNYSYKDS